MRSHDWVIFSDSYSFSYGEFGDIKIKLHVEVTAIAAADNLGQRGQSIILRKGTEGCLVAAGGAH